MALNPMQVVLRALEANLYLKSFPINPACCLVCVCPQHDSVGGGFVHVKRSVNPGSACSTRLLSLAKHAVTWLFKRLFKRQSLLFDQLMLIFLQRAKK